MSGYTILIADDSRVSRMLIMSIVKSLLPAARLLEAKDSQEALKWAAHNLIDVATLDLDMPGGMNGLELAKALRVRYPVIKMGLLTASEEETILEQVDEQGMSYLRKPIDEDEVRHFIARSLPEAIRA